MRDHGIHVEVSAIHAHNESYSSNEDERVLYKTRRLYVRSNTKSTISSPANPNQSFSSQSIKDKSILYYIQATHNFTPDSSQTQNAAAIRKGEYFAVIDYSEPTNGWLKCVRVGNPSTWEQNCHLDEKNSIVYVPVGYIKKVNKKVTIDVDKPQITEFHTPVYEDDLESIPPALPISMPTSGNKNSPFPDINKSVRQDKNALDFLKAVRVCGNRPVLFYARAIKEYQPTSHFDSQIALKQGHFYAVIRGEQQGWLGGVEVASPETWGVDSRKMTPVRNFPGGFVEPALDVPELGSKTEQNKQQQQAPQQQQKQHQQQITSKASHLPKNNQKTINPHDKLYSGQNLQNFPYKQHPPQYTQQQNNQQLPHSNSTPNFHKPVTNQNNLQKSNSRPEFNLPATQNYLTPAKPLVNDNFNNRTDRNNNHTKNNHQRIEKNEHYHRSTNKIVENHRVIGQSYRNDEIDGQTTASSGDNPKEVTPLFDENNNNNTGKYIPPRYVPPVSKPISYKRPPILKNTGYIKQIQPSGPTMTQKLCSNDSSLSDWIDTLLLTLIIILAFGPTSIGTMMALRLPELNTIPPVTIILGVLNIIPPLISIYCLQVGKNKKLGLNPMYIILLIIINLIVINFIMAFVQVSVNAMNLNLAKIFTSELLEMQTSPKTENKPFRLHEVQQHMDCCGFHTALDYCYPESVEYFSESQRSTKVAQEAFDDMLRATKDHQFMLKRYNQCRPTYQPCDQFTVSSGCKIEIITYVENMKNSVCVFVVFIAAIWFLILLKVHLLTWCLKKFGYTESRSSGHSDSQSRSTEQTKMEGEFDANNNGNNNNNKNDRHVYRRNKNNSGEERRNGRNLAMGEEIKTMTYRPANIIFGTKDTHERVGEYVRSHRRDETNSLIQSTSSKSAYV